MLTLSPNSDKIIDAIFIMLGGGSESSPDILQGQTVSELSERRLSRSEATYRNQTSGASFDTPSATQPTHLSALEPEIRSDEYVVL